MRPSDVERRQRRWELSRAFRAALRLAELLEMAGQRKAYKDVRAIAAELHADLAALDGPDEQL